MRRLPAEWEPQDGVLLGWPHERTDWKRGLEAVQRVFCELIAHISRYERVVVVAPRRTPVLEKLSNWNIEPKRVQIYEIPNNDTWARDFGPITVLDGGLPLLLDFGFNGWGLKFAANLDNQITRALHRAGAFKNTPLQTQSLILEGGSIETDGAGTLLTTAECLLSPNRNPHLSRDEIDRELKATLGVDRILWLENGYLAGDDTDSHIDTLARFAPEDTILHVQCDDDDDEHAVAIQAMVEQLRSFRTLSGRPYRRIPLPWPEPRFDASGERLPATYANFLVTNGAVLVPTYEDRSDAEALAAVGLAFPRRAVIGVNCLPLIEEHGSLHCVTMQIPKGVFA